MKKQLENIPKRYINMKTNERMNKNKSPISLLEHACPLN